MFRQARTNASKLLAGFLAVVMILSMVPVGIVFNVFAAEVETYTVKLPADVSAKVTVTDDNDAAKVFTADTDENFEAVFENLDDETTYTLVVSGMELYKNYTKTGVVADAAAPLEILDTDLSEKDAQAITFAEESITKTFGDEAFAVTLSDAGLGTGAKTYSSTKETVAKINTNGIVTIIGAGTTEIKVSIAADENYKAAEDTLTLTVEQAENAISYTATSVNWVFKDIKTNELTVKDGAIGSVTYASDNDAVAKVDATTGEVTILKPGSANITATFVAGAESNYKNSTASYAITATKKANALSYDSGVINKTYGDGKGVNDTLRPEDVTGTITYSSENESVATVDPTTGEYTIVGAGTTKITATLADDDIGYDIASAFYTLNVAKKENALSFASASQTYTYGDPVTANKLTVALQNLGGFTGPVTYESSAPDVVSVNSTTGAITILKSGDATITASIAEENNYAAATASYTVHVDKKVVTVVINKEIAFGQDDPVLTDAIRNAVKNELVNNEDTNDDIIDRVAGCISYKYDRTPVNGKNRNVGTYDIIFFHAHNDGECDDFADADNCYAFNLSGELKVTNNFNLTNGIEYEIVGLNSASWGSEKDTVVIKVTDESKYSISADDSHRNDWTEKQLVFSTPENNSTEHEFYIKDLTTNRVSKKKTETFGIDGTNPTINKFTFKVKGNSAVDKVIYYLSFGAFCNEEVEVEVLAADPAKNVNTNDVSGVESIKLYYNDQFYGSSTVDGNAAKFTLTLEQFAELKTISAIATDKVGNTPTNANGEEILTYANSENSGLGSNKWNGLLQLEQIPAEITVTYDAPTSTNGDKKWYGKDIAFNVAVSDLGDTNSGIRSVWAKINGTTVKLYDFTTSPDNAEPADNIFYFISDDRTVKVSEVSFKLDTTQVNVPTKPDGEYRIEIFACDNAGTIVKYDATTEKAIVDTDSAKNIIVNIDRDDPIITGFEFKAEKSIEGNSQPVATVESYGYFFTQDTDVVVTAKDVRPSSGVKHIEFYTITKEGVRKDYEASSTFVDTSDADTVIVSATFTVPKGFKGQIYARAVDNVNHTTVVEENETTGNIDDATNTTPKFFNPNGAAIEDEDMHKTHSAATVTLVDETTYTDSNNLPLYKWAADDSDETPDGIPVKLYVKDTFSGISSITWKVTAPYNATEEDPAGTTTVGIYLDGAVAVGDVIDGWTVESVDKNLVTEMSKVIYVTNNSNAIKVDLSFNDRALNSSKADTLYFSIDNTIPTIEVVYDNNTPDEEYTDIYKANRIATITITERNFRAKDVVFAITNTDKTIPAVDLTAEATWKLVENDDPDKITHVATIEYAADGDYTFDISYKDNVENAAAAFAQHKFTLDKTIPTVTVVYDNMSALNGNYFKADRTATITIKEHNFDAKRVNVIGIATDSATGEAVATTFPATSEWKDNGDDTYTATIAYTADSKYSFDIEFLDKAGNSIEDYKVEEFYVDKTAPTLDITGVADKSANNGDVAPIITYSDTNFNKDAVTITLSGINNGTVNYTGAYGDITNGQTYTYANFEKVQNVDDIYTLTAKLTDMAGNETEKTITFSANRFGSVYDLATVKDLIGKYLQNEEDIVFTETNVDSLDREGIKIKLTKNGTPTDLVEGTDYTVEVTGGNGQLSVYKYTVNKKLFADDGRYSISIYSKDAAGNVNENIDETKEAEISFGIDKTKPVIVPIDFESGVQYAVEMKTVSVEIKDNLVLEGVKIYLNGKEIEYKVDGETYTFDVPEATSKQDVKIVATDAAGNEFEVAVEEFLVNTNIFVRWYNNTPLFVGSIIGVVVLALALTAFLLFGKKKKKGEEK